MPSSKLKEPSGEVPMILVTGFVQDHTVNSCYDFINNFEKKSIIGLLFSPNPRLKFRIRRESDYLMTSLGSKARQ